VDTVVRVVFSLVSLGGLTIGILVIIAKLNKIEKELQELKEERAGKE